MSVSVVGNLTKDVSYHDAKDGKKSFASVRVAINCGKDQKTVFMPVKCWGYTADDSRNLKKGDKVIILGRLCMEEWAKDGETISEIGLIADNIGKIQREFPNTQESDF